MIQFFTEQLRRLAETLKVYDFSFTQKFDSIIHIRVITEPKNIVVGYSRFLFWYVELFTTIFSSLFENK